VVGFTGRENPDHPDSRMGKYINTPNTLIYDKSRILYGLDKAKMDMRKDNLCVLVEGQTDVIMSHQAGFKNVVASSGTALTNQQLKIIKRYTDNLAMAFDMDSAGEIATQRGIDLAIQFGFNTKVISLPDHIKDPADFIQKNPSAWSKAINQAQGLMEFYLANAFSKHDSETAQGKREISKIILPIVKKIPNKVEQAHWLQEIARRLKVQEGILIEEMDKIKQVLVERSFEPTLKQPSNLENQSSNLEEYALGLVLCHPKKFKKFRKKQCYFIEPDLEQIFKALGENKSKKVDLNSFKKGLPVQLIDKVDELIFKAEAKKDLIEEFCPEKEIEFCFNELKDRYFRQKLNQLNLAIQEAESKKDKPILKKLTREFNKLAKEI
jgi:DNA primase